MQNEIVEYFTKNKLAICFTSASQHDFLCSVFGLVATEHPSFGVVSFFKVECGSIHSAYRFCPFEDKYWDWHQYEFVSVEEFMYLIDETTSILELVQ